MAVYNHSADTNVKPIKTARVISTKGKLRKIKMDRWLYLMLLPGIIYFLLFKYGPMWGS